MDGIRSNLFIYATISIGLAIIIIALALVLGGVIQ